MTLTLLPLASMSRAVRLVAMSTILQNIVNETVPKVEIKSTSPLMQLAFSNKFGRNKVDWENAKIQCNSNGESDESKNNRIRDAVIQPIRILPAIDVTTNSYNSPDHRLIQSHSQYLGNLPPPAHPVLVQIHTSVASHQVSNGPGGNVQAHQPISIAPGTKLIIVQHNSAENNPKPQQDLTLDHRNWAFEAAVTESLGHKPPIYPLHQKPQTSLGPNLPSSLSILSTGTPQGTQIHVGTSQVAPSGMSVASDGRSLVKNGASHLVILQERELREEKKGDLTESAMDQNTMLIAPALKELPSTIKPSDEIKNHIVAPVTVSSIESLVDTNRTIERKKKVRNKRKRIKSSVKEIEVTTISVLHEGILKWTNDQLESQSLDGESLDEIKIVQDNSQQVKNETIVNNQIEVKNKFNSTADGVND